MDGFSCVPCEPRFWKSDVSNAACRPYEGSYTTTPGRGATPAAECACASGTFADAPAAGGTLAVVSSKQQQAVSSKQQAASRE